MLSYISYKFNSPYDKKMTYKYDINNLPLEEEWMEHCDFSVFKNILLHSRTVYALCIDPELVKYCLKQVEEMECSLSCSSYRGICGLTREEILFKIIENAPKLKKIIIHYVEQQIDMSILSLHKTIEYLEFQLGQNEPKIISEPKIIKKKRLNIKISNQQNLDDLNSKYNKFNIYFI
jgi:hypothetical protein